LNCLDLCHKPLPFFGHSRRKFLRPASLRLIKVYSSENKPIDKSDSPNRAKFRTNRNSRFFQKFVFLISLSFLNWLMTSKFRWTTHFAAAINLLFKINNCAVFDICPANDSIANSNLMDWQSRICRAKSSLAICSNTAKIKLLSYSILFISKLLKIKRQVKNKGRLN